MCITVTLLLVVVLLVIKCVLKPIMKRAGEENQDYYSGLYKWIDQSVMGIKEIKIACREPYFINEYSQCGAGYVSAVQRYNLYNATPRLLIETVAIAGMVLYMMIQLLSGTGAVDIMPQLTLLALVAVRLIPCANRINNHLTSIAYFEPFFMGVSDNLQEEIQDENVDYAAETYQKSIDVVPLLPYRLPVSRRSAAAAGREGYRLRSFSRNRKCPRCRRFFRSVSPYRHCQKSTHPYSDTYK